MDKKDIFVPKAPTLEKPVEKKVEFSIDLKQKIPSLPEIKDKTKIDLRYALIVPYAYVHIYWDDLQGELIYYVEEPNLDTKEKEILNLVRQGIEELINMSFISVKEKESLIEYLEKNVSILLKEFAIELEKSSYLKVMYYVYRDFVGLNKIEPLMNDYYIEDIECNGKNSPLYIVHRKFGNIKTNIIYYDFDELLDFVEKLAQKCGKYISYATPLLDAALPDGSRCNATFTEDVTSRGPSFSIRKFTREPWSPIKLMQIGSVSAELLAYLWLLIENGSNILIVGGTGSGKTTFLNTIAFFIPPQARIISIEDTRELNLVHENWLPSVARAGILGLGGGGEKSGEISLFDLLKESFRQRPDYVIVGEVRGKEAYVLFQGMASIKGDEEILVLNDNHPKKIKIKDLKLNTKYKAMCMDEYGKIKIMPIKTKFIHAKRNKLYRLFTKRGREITLTPNHSIFSYCNNKIEAKYSESLKEGDNIIIPANIPCGYANIGYFNLLKIPGLRVYAPDYVKEAVRRLSYEGASKVCGVKSISDFYSNFKRSKCSSLSVQKFILLMRKAGIKYDLDKIKVKSDNNSYSCNAKLKISDELLRLLGYYISEGTMQNKRKRSKLALYAKREEILEDMKYCIKGVVKGVNIRERVVTGYGTSKEISFSHKPLLNFIEQCCGTGSLNKRIPEFIFGLSKKRVGQFLSGLYSGDGCFTKKCFSYYTISEKLASDLVQLLNVYGIVSSVGKRKIRKNIDYVVSFCLYEDKKEFLKYVNPIRKKISLIKGKKRKLINDVYIDKIKKIEEIKLSKPEHVYDISVPGVQNFVGGFGGVMLHNSGHPSLSTMHADDVATVIRRLETPPINLSPSLVETLDAVCLMTFAKVGGKETRKVRAVEEIIEVDERGKAKINTPFEWNPRTNKFMFKRQSIVLDKLVMKKGISREKLNIEFTLRSRLLLKLYEKKIFDFVEVQKIIHAYYKTPERVLKRFNLQ